MEHIVFDADLAETVQPRSCDQCYLRKTKCTRRRPCQACSVSTTTCTYERRTQYRRKAVRMSRRDTLSLAGESALATPASVSPVSTDTFNPGTGNPTASPTGQNNGDNARQLVATPPDAFHAGPPVQTGELDSSYGTFTVDWVSLFPDDAFVSFLLSSNLQVDSPLVHEATAVQTAAPSALPRSLCNASTSTATTDELFFLMTIFLQRLRPSMPFFEPSYLLDNLHVARHTHDRAFHALVHAIGALVLFQPMQGPDKDLLPDRTRRGNALLETAVQLHARTNLGQRPVLEDVLTSVFLFACQFCLGNHNAARFRLHEGMALGETMHLHNPKAYGNVTLDERDRRLRTLLCLTIIEKYTSLDARLYSIQRDCPLYPHSLTARSIHAVLALVLQGYTHYDRPEETTIMAGLSDMIALVDFIDDRVVRCWKNRCWLESTNARESESEGEGDQPQHVSRATVCALLRRYSLPMVPPRPIGGGSVSDVHDVQYVDILVTRHWIRNMLWNLGQGHGFMDETSADVEMRPSYTLVIARETIETCEQFSMSTLEVHGLGLVEKLYDIATSAMYTLATLRQAAIVPVPMPDAPVMEPSSLDLDTVGFQTEAVDVAASRDHSSQACQVYEAAADNTSPTETETAGVLSCDFVNRFLAIFASFRGGKHIYLRRYVQKLCELSLFDE